MTLVCAVNSEPIPGYRLLAPLGKGGYGEVWKCEAPGGLVKAIKVVSGSANATNTDNGAEQEHRALQLVKAIRHPFLLSTERVEIVDDDLFIVMELADRSLHDLLGEYRASGLAGIPRADLIGYLREAAEVLDLMNHDHDLQHLDIKPRNLFLVGRHVKVADFGLVSSLAEMTGAAPHTVQLGAVTPLYAAPESFLGKISRHSDQYSLAIAYCELLTGALPFNGKNFRQLAMQHLQEAPNLDRLPESDRPAVQRALAKDPTQRFPSCLEFIHALEPGPPISSTNIALAKSSPEIDLGGSTQRPKSATAHDIDLGNLGVTPKGAVPVVLPSALLNASRPPQSAAPAVTGELKNYRLLECVGRQPGGELWKGQALTGQPCTIRFVFDVESVDDELEGRAIDRLRALRHPALAPLEIEHNGPRLALIYAGGDHTLLTRLKECQLAGLQGIPRFDLLQHLRAVAGAFDALFQSFRLQHLGLMPRQLYLTDETVRVADFGLVELFWLPAGHQPGGLNARYAPPELFERQVTRAADQYSLALIFQELLTGIHPFRNMNPRQMASPKLRGKPDLGMLPATDRPIVMKALHPDPDRRFATCTELIDALETGRDAADAPPVGTPLRGSAAGRVMSPPPGSSPGKVRGPLPGSAAGRVQPIAPTPFPARPAPTSAEPRVGTPNGPKAVVPAAVTDAVAKVVESAAGTWLVRETNHIRYRLKPGESIEHRCFAHLIASMTLLKLDAFRDQWCADVKSAKSGTYVLQVPIRGSVIERFFGAWPSLEIELRCLFPQDATVGLAEIAVTIKPVGCGQRRGADLLERVGPTLLASLRSFVKVDDDRRAEERMPFAYPIQVYPVDENQKIGDPIDGHGRDISLHGMGVFLPTLPTAPQVCLQFTWSSSTTPMTLLAKVMSAQACPGGGYVIGMFFLQNLGT